MVLIDIVVVILIVFFGIKGYGKGVLYTTMRLIGGVVAILIATHFSGFVADRLFQSDNHYLQVLLPSLGFIVTLLICLLGVNILSKIILRPVNHSPFSPLNKLLGALVYAFFISIVFGSLIWVLKSIDLISESALEGSYISRYLLPLMPVVFDIVGSVMPVFKTTFQELNTYFEKLSDSIY